MHRRQALPTLAATTMAVTVMALTATMVQPAPVRAADPASPEGDRIETSQGALTVHPLNHATFVMEWQDMIIHVDPVGGAERFEQLPPPDLILITHEHSDHFDADTLSAVAGDGTEIVTPRSVHDALPAELAEKATVMANGDTETVSGVAIEAVPAYNTTEERLQYHPKGRDNGYVLTLGDRRVYIAGDTEDIPEMRALRDIDVAFVPMNLPYTMTVEQAADAVREFAPGIVYPYHSRDSDVDRFAELVGEDDGIEVRLRDWY
ncbi:MAG TPA: MBL fold metallo-hydrolase [Arenibaculum sp.]|nr:MBL fold metallo-hydrolase [Arenibaculum sp.]